MNLEVRFVQAPDEETWSALYSGYRAFYDLAADDEITSRVWRWVSTQEQSLRGLVAVDDTGRPVALANIRSFARPSSGSSGLYLDDLYTAPEARGSGAATALLHQIKGLAAAEGHTIVRWITSQSNAAARRVYDANASETPWVTYDMSPGTI